MYTTTEKCMLILLTASSAFARHPHDIEPQATLSRQGGDVKDLLRSGVRRVVSDLHNMYSSPIAREGVNDLPLQIMERRPIPPHNPADGDCLKSERGNLRPYPMNNNCYSRESTVDNKQLWWSLWGEIGGDFRYTFDFVLWDKYFPTRKENQFWYLMLYLKTLAKTIKNHEEIVSMPVYQNEKNKLDKQISVLLEYSKKDEGEKNMMEKLSDISSTMALYQADMRMLDGKLNEVFASVAHVQAHKNMLHSKLADLDLKTSLIQALIQKGQKARAVVRMPTQVRVPMSEPAMPMPREQPGNEQSAMSLSRTQPGYGQAPMSLSRTQPSYGQAPMSLSRTQPSYGQAQMSLSRTQPGYGEAPMSLSRTQPVYGQAPMSSSRTQPVYAQPAMSLSRTQPDSEQSVMSLSRTQPGYGQAPMSMDTLSIEPGNVQSAMYLSGVHPANGQAPMSMPRAQPGRALFKMPIQDRLPMSGQSALSLSGQSRLRISGQSPMLSNDQARLAVQAGIPTVSGTAPVSRTGGMSAMPNSRTSGSQIRSFRNIE